MNIDWNKVEEGYSLMQTLEKENKQLKDQLQQKENIIKEVREYIEDTPRIVKSIHYRDKESNYAFIENYVKGELLEILDKENV